MKFQWSTWIVLAYSVLVLPHQALAQQPELSVPGQNLYVNKINVAQSLWPFWNGAGTTVSVKEFAFDTTDVDLTGRVLLSPNASTNQTIHANVMASLIGGAGNADLQGRGVAPGCKLLSSSFVGLMPDSDYEGPNIGVQNHSYGVDIQNWYGAGAQAYDRTTETNPVLLHVFSAGNKGDSASTSGTYAGIKGFANLSGNFKMAKNALIVGAVDSLARVDPFSSRGPAYDGRTKPDLVAFGYDGSSGAAALVSGSAAVLQQILVNDLPSSDLVRAILINSADDLRTPGPDFDSGFGNLNLKNAVSAAENKHFLTETIVAGQTLQFPINIPANIRQFKITLAWTDPPAAPNAANALLNDLDLSIIDPMGNEFLPWVLNTFPHPDSLRQAARRGRDTLNNVEQVVLDFPQPGTWFIRVNAAHLSAGNQPFALAWDWDTAQHFEWTYPYLNDPTPANKEVVLRWESTFPDTFARLEWRPWPSPEWRLLKDSVKLQRGWTRWLLPDTFAESQVRMLVDGKVFTSDIFLISKELRVKIGANCPDSVVLFWNSAHPSAQYQLYGLGDRYMEPLSILTDTFVVLQKSNFPQSRFAIAPLAPGQDALGPRSAAPDISRQGVECYFSSFLASLNQDIQVDLNLQIGTHYGVEKVFFEKLVGGSFVVLNEQPANNTNFGFTDETPRPGANIYRPRLSMQNGATLTGDPVTVYYEGKEGWWVFPNPVAAGGILTVASATDGEARFLLYDVFGRLVLEHVLDEVGTKFTLEDFDKGVYFFKILEGDIKLGAGKLILD